MSDCVQSAEHGKTKESHSAQKTDKAKQLVEKTASEVKLTADIKVLSSEKVAGIIMWLSYQPHYVLPICLSVHLSVCLSVVYRLITLKQKICREIKIGVKHFPQHE